MTEIPTLELHDGTLVPQLGFGVWQVPPEQTADVVGRALAAGYRHVDTAAGYQNEQGVGEALRRSGIPREEVFITTKLRNGEHGRDKTLRAFDASLAELGIDQLDLYLIHWPQQADDYVETWRAFEEIKASGRVRTIGVSNFHRPHLQRLLDETGTVPTVNQVECHPYLVQAELRAFHAEHRIATEAWSPLAQRLDLVADPVVTGIADALGRTPAQVVLRWHLQQGNVVIPKSVTPERIVANLDVAGFALDADQVDAITALDRGERTGPDPDVFG